jgi:SAM-dependent methyltransferase
MNHPPQAKDQVRRYFDREVADYLDAYREGHASPIRHDAFSERRELVLALTPPGAKRVLDIGAGPGVFTPQLLARGASCAVVDLSFEMIATARGQVSSGARATFMVGDIDHLPLATGVFDAALCVGVLQYLPSLDFALIELARVVAPGGHVIVTFPNAGSPLNGLHRAAAGVARGALGGARLVGLAGAPDPSRLTFRQDIPNRWISAAQVYGAARAAGLRVDETVYHALQFPFAVPGLQFAVDRWNRKVRGRLPTGMLASWGREGIVRLVRE